MAIRALAPLLIALSRPHRLAELARRRLGAVWLWCWRREGMRFERQDYPVDPFCFWERCAPRDLAMMAQCGAVRLFDPISNSQKSGRDSLLALCALNCAQAPGIGCDSTDWRDWLSSLEALLARATPSERELCFRGLSLPCLEDPHSRATQGLPVFFLNALIQAPERLAERSELSLPALLSNFSVSLRLAPEGADLSEIARLCLLALDGIDANGEALWLLAHAPGGAQALLERPELAACARRRLAALSFLESRSLSSAPLSLGRTRAL